MSDETVIILGAGRPHRGLVPSALRADRDGTPVIEWLLDALGVGIQNVTLIGGYEVDSIRARYPNLRVVVSKGWDQTGSAASLLAAPLESGAAALVVYSDVLVRPNLVAAVRSGEGDVTVGWDSAWRKRFAGRRRGDLVRREKVVITSSKATALGPELDIDEASGEFIGLVQLSARAVDEILFKRELLKELLPDRAHLSQLVENLREAGMSVHGVDAAGDWAEIDEPSDIARFVLGTKADTLARLSRLVRRSRVGEQVTRTVSEWVLDPRGSIAEVTQAFGNRLLVVRSSTAHEDAFSGSNAGGFTSVLGVRAQSGLVEAVQKVVSSYRDAGLDSEVQQILIQPLIEGVVRSGVVLTRTLDHGAPWIVVEYSEGENTEAVTSGRSDATRTLFLHRGTISGCLVSSAAALDLARLSGLLEAVEEVEGLLANDALDIEFAIDCAGEVHLLQVRPAVTATTAPRRDDVFEDALRAAHATWTRHAEPPAQMPGRARLVLGIMPDWNPAEIIGTAPGRLALDLYRRLLTDEVWAVQRAEVGYRDVRPAPLLVDIAGRPYVDVRASFASFIPAVLDERLAGRLLAAGLERLVADPRLHDKVEFAVMPTCVSPDWVRWERLLTADGFRPREIANLGEALTHVTGSILSRVDRDLLSVQELSGVTRRASRGIADPLVRAAALLSAAASSGTLPFAHLARAAFVAKAMFDGARTCGAIGPDAMHNFLTSSRTVSGELVSDAEAVSARNISWTEFVARWGHLRPGTYEITSPRYDSDPERFLRPRIVATGQGESLTRDAKEAWSSERDAFIMAMEAVGLDLDAALIERTLRRAIEGRESAKLAFTRNLSDALECIAHGWEMRGVERAILSDAPLALLLPDASGKVSDASRVVEAALEGRARRQVAEAMPLAPLLTSPDDLEAFVLGADMPNFVGLYPVTARVVELSDGSRIESHLSQTIVLIPRADPGFDWIFGFGIVGIITLYGGANSHMAIRAAEHGLAAAIGIGEQRYRALQGATEVELDPRKRTIRRVS